MKVLLSFCKVEKISIPSLYEVFKKHPVISTDTRTISPDSIFFALKGPTFNGNQFASMALEKGAAYVVVDEEKFVLNERCLLVEDGLKALQLLANHHRRQLKIPFLAITGSNGKTTTKELVRNVLAKKFRTLATIGNLNNHIGVPLTILSIGSDIEFAVIEMGANHQKEIESYCLIAEPDYGLITNVGKAHLEGFGGFEGVKKGKGELYQWVREKGKKIFINRNNTHLVEMSVRFNQDKLVSYGTSAENYCSGQLLSDEPFLKVSWKCEGRSGTIDSHIIGSYNFENILSAICIGNYFGVTPADIDAAISSYVADNSRSQLIKKGSNTIILDAYNANPTSMEAALRNFDKAEAEHKVICIGDMAELGAESDKEHERITHLLKSIRHDQLILVGKNFGKFASQLPCLHFTDSQAAAAYVKEHPFDNSYILIKGSRSSKMEKVLEVL